MRVPVTPAVKQARGFKVSSLWTVTSLRTVNDSAWPPHHIRFTHARRSLAAAAVALVVSHPSTRHQSFTRTPPFSHGPQASLSEFLNDSALNGGISISQLSCDHLPPKWRPPPSSRAPPSFMAPCPRPTLKASLWAPTAQTLLWASLSRAASASSRTPRTGGCSTERTSLSPDAPSRYVVVV